MRKSAKAALERREETTAELVGVLTAISVISKRLAKKLALLDKSPPGERGNGQGGAVKAAATHADQSRAL